MTDMTDATKPSSIPSSSVLRRAAAASAIGNATEWFDYGLYAYGVTYISAAIFPGNVQQATFLALATFAISFLIRPLGGFFWGPLGDRFGRKSVLAMTIVLMAAATFLVGLTPSYKQIGIWSPLLLVVLRMVQGFSTGGEYGGAAIFIAEYAPDFRRGFYGSFLEFGTLCGFSLGALLMLGASSLLGEEQMHHWGWRLPFLIAGPLGLVGTYLRSKLEDTPVFLQAEAAEEAAKKRRPALHSVLTDYWRPLLVMSGLVIALNVVNYTLLSYMPTYLERRLGLSTQQALYVPIIGMLTMMLVIPLAGGLSDRVGRKPMWWVSLVGLFLFVVPLYHLMSLGVVWAIVGFAAMGLLYVPQLATISATFPAMFPTHVRFTGFALAYNVSTSLFGGSAPAFNSWLIARTGQTLAPAYSMMAACLIGMIAVYFMFETAGRSLHGRHVPGSAEALRTPGE